MKIFWYRFFHGETSPLLELNAKTRLQKNGPQRLFGAMEVTTDLWQLLFWNDRFFCEEYHFKGKKPQPRDCFDSSGAEQKYPAEEQKAWLDSFFMASHDERGRWREGSRAGERVEDCRQQYVQCFFFFLYACQRKLQYVYCSLHVFLRTDQKKKKSNWQTVTQIRDKATGGTKSDRNF